MPAFSLRFPNEAMIFSWFGAIRIQHFFSEFERDGDDRPGA
jgi:hypothetical protein